ncbi:hypothetical protein HK405_015497, partial [Cladochytrium tenue]
MTQARDGLAMMQALSLIDYLVTHADEPGVRAVLESTSVVDALKDNIRIRARLDVRPGWGILLRPPDWYAAGNLLANRTVDTVRALLDKHLISTLELLQVSGQVKATAKGPVSAIALGVQTAPLELGFVLLLLQYPTSPACSAALRPPSPTLAIAAMTNTHGASGEPGTMTWWKPLTGLLHRPSLAVGRRLVERCGHRAPPALAVLGSGGADASFDDEEIGFEDVLELDGDTA